MEDDINASISQQFDQYDEMFNMLGYGDSDFFAKMREDAQLANDVDEILIQKCAFLEELDINIVQFVDESAIDYLKRIITMDKSVLQKGV